MLGIGEGEYLPSKAYANRFYIATREERIYAISGKALIENEEKNGTNLKANVKTYDEETVLELPYIYYPGYEITLDGMHVETFETENGMLGIKVGTNDENLLEVKYSGSEIMKNSLLVSTVGAIGLCVYILLNRKEKEKCQNQ